MNGELKVDLGALAHNFQVFSRGRPSSVAAVVKANAYGIGIKEVATKLWELGCREFFVAFVEEGKVLRSILSAAQIYVFAGINPSPAEMQNSIREYLDHELIPILNSIEQCRGWSGVGSTAALHVDTGMTRLGIAPEDIHEVSTDLNLDLNLLVSHFARADEVNNSFNNLQTQRLVRAHKALKSRHPSLRLSLANSAGSLAHEISVNLSEALILDRVGIGLYGVSPFTSQYADRVKNLRPVVSLYGRVLQVRDAVAATPIGYGSTYQMPKAGRLVVLDVGYADGMPRLLSNKGRAFFAGEFCPIRGRISMDATTVEVGAIEVAPGDLFELMGEQIDIAELADHAQTIPYEILTGLSQRLTKVYIED
jgi:alanine racemase